MTQTAPITSASDFTYASLQQQAADLRYQDKLFIDGKLVSAQSGKTFPTINPANGQEIVQIADGVAKDIDAAVAAARQAFDAGPWPRLSFRERKEIILRMAAILKRRQLEFALLETVDSGKPISNSYNSDIMKCIWELEWFAEAGDKIYDEIAPRQQGTLGLIRREPIGVVGAVTPWNFPLSMLIWKMAPALILGNTMVSKPAEQTPLTALMFAEIAQEAGLPEGVLNIVSGGPEAGEAIGRHMDIDCVAFTGSTEVGKAFLRYAGESNMKKVWLECGGKSPNVVFDDYSDVQTMATSIAGSIFYNQGEVCCACSRLIVHQSMKDQVVELVKGQAANWQPGDPLDPATTMGAMIEKVHYDKVAGFLQQGKQDARLVCGGNPVRQETGGWYIEPTIFDDVRDNSTLWSQEIFGPVLAVSTFTEESEAVRLANDTTYGLAANVWTGDIGRAHRVADQIRAGTVTINGASMGFPYTPFGGYRQSGIGRDGSLHAFDKFSELKTVAVKL